MKKLLLVLLPVALLPGCAWMGMERAPDRYVKGYYPTQEKAARSAADVEIKKFELLGERARAAKTDYERGMFDMAIGLSMGNKSGESIAKAMAAVGKPAPGAMERISQGLADAIAPAVRVAGMVGAVWKVSDVMTTAIQNAGTHNTEINNQGGNYHVEETHATAVGEGTDTETVGEPAADTPVDTDTDLDQAG